MSLTVLPHYEQLSAHFVDKKLVVIHTVVRSIDVSFHKTLVWTSLQSTCAHPASAPPQLDQRPISCWVDGITISISASRRRIGIAGSSTEALFNSAHPSTSDNVSQRALHALLFFAPIVAFKATLHQDPDWNGAEWNWASFVSTADSEDDCCWSARQTCSLATPALLFMAILGKKIVKRGKTFFSLCSSFLTFSAQTTVVLWLEYT